MASKLKAVKYVGDISILKGKTALARPDEDPDYWLVQFDDLNLRYHGVGLAFNWHRFLKSDFKFKRGGEINERRLTEVGEEPK